MKEVNSCNKGSCFCNCSIIPEVGKHFNGWALRRKIQKVLWAGMVKISYISKKHEINLSIWWILYIISKNLTLSLTNQILLKITVQYEIKFCPSLYLWL